MMRYIGKYGLTWILAVVLGGTFAAGAQEAMHARVSYDAGSTMIKGGDDPNWVNAAINTLVFPGDTLWVDREGTAEIEFAGGSYLRMADGSKVEVLTQPPSASLRAWAGSIYVHRLSRSSGDFAVNTPSGVVNVEDNSNVRFDIAGNGATVVSVRWGRATVRASGGDAVTATEGTQVYIDPGLLPSNPVSFDRSIEDAFDSWNRERCQALANGVTAVPAGVTVAPTTLGVADLASSGEWVYVTDRYYWRPTVVVDYVPYRVGYWSYVPAYGHVWVGHHNFAYITSHYGRWSYFPTYGWCWAYDPIWSPAWVATVRCGPYFAWTPIDFYNRPVCWSESAYFSIGGLQFSYFATSCVSDSYLYWGPSYIRPLYGTDIVSIYADDIHIWNIYSRPNDHYRIPYRDNRLTVRDYNPPRSIRGLDTYGPTTRTASERVRALETSLGRDRFATVEQSGVRSVRTASNSEGRAAAVRTVSRIERPDRDSLIRSVDAGGAVRNVRTSRSDVDSEAAKPRTRAIPRGSGGERGTAVTPDSPRTSPAVRGTPSGSGDTPRTPTTRTIPTVRSTPEGGRGDVRKETRDTSRTPAPETSRPAPSVRSIPSRTAPEATRTAPRTESPTPRSSVQRTAPETRPTAPSTRSETRTAPTPRRITVESPRTETRETRTAPQVRTYDEPTRRSVPETRSYEMPRQSAPQVRDYDVPVRPAPSTRTYDMPRQSAPSTRTFDAPRQSAPAPRTFDAPRPSAPSGRSFEMPSRPSSESRPFSIDSGRSSGDSVRSIGSSGRSRGGR